MYCPYCDSEKTQECQNVHTGEMTVCPNCGGEVPVGQHTSATQCPFCDSYLILDERVEGSYTPKMMIPFQMGKEACKQSLREKFKKFRFAPTDFLSEVRLNSIEGVYVPYWFYDYDTNCDYQGEGTKVRSWRSGNMQYTETSFYDIHRNMEISFRKIPVDASEQMPDDVMDLIAPFDYGQLIAFLPEYLSGFHGEKYNMGAEVVENRANALMRTDAEKLMKESYSGQGYSTVRTIRQDVSVRTGSAAYGLLPVWRYLYRYGEQDYPFYVNGQTGKIVGVVPISRGKVWGYTATLWGCLTVLMVLLNVLVGLL